MNFNFTPFPVLSTRRLSLRKLALEDDKEIFFLRSNNLNNKYLDRTKAVSLEDANDFINKINHAIENNECIDWAITFKNDSRLIGSICLWNISKEENKAEVGYELLPSFQGKGIAQEALSEVINFGFDVMKLQTIEAYTHKDNLSSTKLLEKFNFTRDPKAEAKIDRAVDPKNVVYSLYKIT
jgi:ribosomal-protein-alanine N-acetyltransferase